MCRGLFEWRVLFPNRHTFLLVRREEARGPEKKRDSRTELTTHRPSLGESNDKLGDVINKCQTILRQPTQHKTHPPVCVRRLGGRPMLQARPLTSYVVIFFLSCDPEPLPIHPDAGSLPRRSTPIPRHNHTTKTHHPLAIRG